MKNRKKEREREREFLKMLAKGPVKEQCVFGRKICRILIYPKMSQDGH